MSTEQLDQDLVLVNKLHAILAVLKESTKNSEPLIEFLSEIISGMEKRLMKKLIQNRGDDFYGENEIVKKIIKR